MARGKRGQRSGRGPKSNAWTKLLEVVLPIAIDKLVDALIGRKGSR